MKALITRLNSSHELETTLVPGQDECFSYHNGVLSPVPSNGFSQGIRVTFEPRYAAWKIRPEGEISLWVNRKQVQKSKVLTNGDEISLQEALFKISYSYDAPKVKGEECDQVSLVGLGSLEVGRASNEGHSPDVSRLELDRHVFSISRQHFRLVSGNSGWSLENLSDFGTEINSRLVLDQHSLVYGDRIRLGEYIFQFESDSLRRIDHSHNGSVLGKALAVVVSDRATGKPKRILDTVTVGAKQGEFVGILGGSGQGKSTLLTALCGLRKCSEGEALIGGIPSTAINQKAPGAIGYVPQDDIVHVELTVERALYYSSKLRQKLRKGDRAGLVDRMIDVLGLTDHRLKRVDQLSGGQRKRVSIAIELLSKPEVLFLDEPSSGLDPATEKTLMELLQSLALNNLTVICTTHVLQNAFLFDRLWYIHSGKLIFSGDADAARDFFLDQSASMATSQPGGAPLGDLEKIYSKVLGGDRTGAEWEQRFVSSQAGQTETSFVDRLANSAKKSELAPSPQPKAPAKFFTLLRRQLALLSASKLNLLFLAAQVLVIGLLLSWVSDDSGFRNFLGIIAAMWFGCSNGAQEIVKEGAILAREQLCGLGSHTYALSKLFFHGILASLQAFLLFLVVTFAGHYFHAEEFDLEHFSLRFSERNHPMLADERPIEEDAGDWMPMEEGMEDVGDDAFFNEDFVGDAETEEPEVAKPTDFQVWCTELFNLRENILDSGPKPLTMSDNRPVIGDDFMQMTSKGVSVNRVLSVTIGLRLLSYLAAAIVGVALGLAVSSLVQTPIQSVMWVPLLLIPQILFGGFVINLPEMPKSVQSVARFFPSFSCQRLADVSYLYGREVPFLTNKTKTPQFLTTDGSKERVKWEQDGRKFSQAFEKISDANVAWQNLVVDPGVLGQHKQHRTPGSSLGSYDYPESISDRRDVLLDKGTSYLNTNAVGRPLITLGSWVAICYLTIIVGIWRGRKKS